MIESPGTQGIAFGVLGSPELNVATTAQRDATTEMFPEIWLGT